jgi:beta-galactosidase GanA
MLETNIFILALGLPVPGLWVDILQKIKALGYNCVSFYTYWALLEGKPGEFTAEGVFALEPFFEAALEAGVYILAVSSTFCILFWRLTSDSDQARTSMPRSAVEATLDGFKE